MALWKIAAGSPVFMTLRCPVQISARRMSLPVILGAGRSCAAAGSASSPRTSATMARRNEAGRNNARTGDMQRISRRMIAGHPGAANAAFVSNVSPASVQARCRLGVGLGAALQQRRQPLAQALHALGAGLLGRARVE